MDKREAIELLEDVKTITKVTIDEMAALNFAIEALGQTERTGEWKWESEDICDNCGYEIPHLERTVGDIVLMDSKDWNYCPNCGAKMGGDTE